MGFFGNLKKNTKAFVEKEREKARDRRQYEDQVKMAVKKARREAYLKEATKQAQVKARMEAKRRFNPSPQQQAGGLNIPASLLDPVGYSMGGTPKKKKKKKGKDPLHDLIYGT